MNSKEILEYHFAAGTYLRHVTVHPESGSRQIFIIENVNHLINRLKDRLAMLPDLCPDLTRTENPITPIDRTRESLSEKSKRNVTESKEYAMPDDLKADFEFFQEEFRKSRSSNSMVNSPGTEL